LSLFDRLSARSRAAKFRILSHLIDGLPSPNVLDLGGQIDSVSPLLRVLPEGASVTVLNLAVEHLDRIRRIHPGMRVVAGDGCRLPFPDGSFDLVYCNAVIEHLRSAEAQFQMAREIQRIGRAWFVTTPNRWFPFEFHTRLPLVSWLPASLMHRAAHVCSYDHMRQRYATGIDQSELRLLSARPLRRMFPTARIVKNRITIWPETLIAYGRAGATSKEHATEGHPRTAVRG
jgi:SAM-dependent methyltransferase